MEEDVDLEILDLGFLGDGRACHKNATIHVPLTLPGERWRVRLTQKTGRDWRAVPLEAFELAERADPPCPHFGRCGGCALQHLPRTAYRNLKRRRIETALVNRELAAKSILPTAESPPASRRRLRLAFDGQGNLGFRARGAHRVVNIENCPVAEPAIERALPALQKFTRKLGKPGEIAVTAAENGLDLFLTSIARPGRQSIDTVHDQTDWLRLCYSQATDEHIETLFQRAEPVIELAGTQLSLPPLSFLQATRDGEKALQSFTVKHLGAPGRIADFFAGLGTFSLAAANAGHYVEAFDTAEPAVRALRATNLIRRAETLDLFEFPPTARALSRYDAVVLDPPRAGAERLCDAIADSRLKRVIYISCAPQTFARDAERLAQAGFSVREILPVDQFLYSAEIELAAFLVRPYARE